MGSNLSLGLVGLMAGALAILPTIAARPNLAFQLVVFGTLGCPGFAGGGLTAWWMRHARLIADANGLRWRGLFGWKSARWADVQDYYDRIPASSQQRVPMSAIIKTSAGTLSFNRQWTNFDGFREQVTRLSTQSAARQWDILGSRPCDVWPRVFRYDTWQNIWTPRILLKLLLTAVAYLIAQPMMQMASLAGQIGWNMTLAMAGICVLLTVPMGWLLLLLFFSYQAAGRRKKERITADTQGIVFEDGAWRMEAAWADVTGYSIVQESSPWSGKYVVETRQGKFDFLGNIGSVILLLAIIQRYATEAADREWKNRVNPEALGGEAARWSGGQSGIGARVYHYKTRFYRASLWVPVSMSLTLGFFAWVTTQGVAIGGSAAGWLTGSGAFGILWLMGWYAYHTYRIETDEASLTRFTPISKQQLLWTQIEDYWLTDEYNNGVVQGWVNRCVSAVGSSAMRN